MVLYDSEDEILHPTVVASRPQSYLKQSATKRQRNTEDVNEEHNAFVGLDVAMTQAQIPDYQVNALRSLPFLSLSVPHHDSK